MRYIYSNSHLAPYKCGTLPLILKPPIDLIRYERQPESDSTAKTTKIICIKSMLFLNKSENKPESYLWHYSQFNFQNVRLLLCLSHVATFGPLLTLSTPSFGHLINVNFHMVQNKWKVKSRENIIILFLVDC